MLIISMRARCLPAFSDTITDTISDMTSDVPSGTKSGFRLFTTIEPCPK